MGPCDNLPGEEEDGDSGDLVSGPAIASSFLPGHTRVVKPSSVLSVSSLGDLRAEGRFWSWGRVWGPVSTRQEGLLTLSSSGTELH